MNRISIEGRKWFDADAARMWEEGTKWDGHNHISLATGSQWNHERLYRTRNGTWIVERSGAYRSSYAPISAEDASAWLVANGRDVPSELLEYAAALEV